MDITSAILDPELGRSAFTAERLRASTNLQKWGFVSFVCLSEKEPPAVPVRIKDLKIQDTSFDRIVTGSPTVTNQRRYAIYGK